MCEFGPWLSNIHRCRKHLRAWVSNVSRQFLIERNILLLVSIRLVAVQRVIERVPICLWIKSSRKHSMISLHCKQIECDASLVVQYTNAQFEPYSFAQLNLARYCAYIAFAIDISVRLHWYKCWQLSSLQW
jgi:hypothetical protein